MHACRHRLGPDQRQPSPGPALPPAPMPRRHPCLAPLPAPLGLRFRALLGLGFAPPPEPRPCAHCAFIAYALLPAARVPLCRHRADPESSSRSLPSGSSARIAPHRAHRAPPPASRPPCADIRVTPPSLSSRCGGPGPWLARTAPYASLFRRMREKGPLPGNIRPKCMLFEIKMATSSPHASVSGRNRAIQDAWRANLAAKGPFPRRGARNHAWREDVASAARPFRGSGMRHGRTGFAPCGAGLACLPHAPPCRLACVRRDLRLPAISPAFIAAVLYASRFAARIAPTHAAIRRAAHCGRDELSIGLFLPPSCCPRRCIAPTDARSPAPPEPQPEPTGPRPRANRASPTRGAICAHPRPATRRASPCRAGPAAVSVIPAKWCGDTIAHTRKLRF